MVLMGERIWKLTSALKTFNEPLKKRSQNFSKGFSFLEILLVLTLVSLLISSAVPVFLNFFSQPHEDEFKHIKSLVKILRNDAILKNSSFCLIFDLKKQQIMTSAENESGRCKTEYLTEPKILEPHDINEGIILQEARPAEKNFLSIGEVSDFFEVRIDSSGFVTPFFLNFFLKESSKSWRIESKGIMGELELKKN